MRASTLTELVEQASAAVTDLYARYAPVAGAELQFAIYPWDYHRGPMFAVEKHNQLFIATDELGGGHKLQANSLEELITAGEHDFGADSMFHWIRPVAALANSAFEESADRVQRQATAPSAYSIRPAIPMLAPLVRPARLALGVLGAGAFATWQADRIWSAPITGTLAYWIGLGTGLGVSLAGAAAWALDAYRRPLTRPRRWQWWQWTTALVWLGAMTVTTPMSRYGARAPGLPPTNGTVVAALAYSVAAFVGSEVALGAVWLRRHRERARNPGRGNLLHRGEIARSNHQQSTE
ncbi:MAG TPA: hypothetical protein VKB59_18095 [Micromonosporaceae bacterium]|nr:hypothetical protein [Micromonosporaceae bacterium]